ncbi:MAG: glycosyl transferase [Methylicorpusculum sp.]|uniref:glycosyl transferase n=1 Tax=Methylicorpusculum sp. TaxID=2713644 RepID=UPI0027312C4B|nr:glycosyl transferase [Methylicorpusculum sp.]MDP2203196.1 glycosyl transferase [Methylicorpusculum sp.]
MRLVYLSPVPWTSFAQRPHKFVTCYHASTGGEVLWIDPYPTRFPSLSDFQRFGAKADRENESNPAWLSVVRPSVLPIEPLPGSGMVNALMWRSLLCVVDEFAQPQDCQLAIGKPSLLALTVLKRLKGTRSVYDAMDDFPAFYTGISRWAIRRRECQLVRNVDAVLASSTVIQRRWTQIRADVQLVHNGLDAEVLPEFVGISAAKGKKILGYVGTIATWFDWDWVIELAKKRPDDLVRLIGPVFCSIPTELPDNIEMLPACNHQAALVAMQEFDIGLIPFKKNKLTASVDPIKYYEYRALGLPIISTDFGEMAFRGGEEGTFLSEGSQDIGAVVELALQHSTTIESVQQFRAGNSWELRFSGAKIIG